MGGPAPRLLALLLAPLPRGRGGGGGGQEREQPGRRRVRLAGPRDEEAGEGGVAPGEGLGRGGGEEARFGEGLGELGAACDEGEDLWWRAGHAVVQVAEEERWGVGCGGWVRRHVRVLSCRSGGTSIV